MAGRVRIGPRKPRRLYLGEWREYKQVTQEALGARLEPAVTGMTVSRWERYARGERGPNLSQPSWGVVEALAEALNIDPTNFYRHPDQPSADELLRDAAPDVRENAFAMIEGLLARAAGRR